MQFNTDSYAAESIAMGAGIGIIGLGIASAITSMIQARQAMAALEQRMADWDNPGLRYEPIRREFILAQLEKIGAYLFTQLPSEIDTLRKINIDLQSISAEPFAVFFALKERILLAGEGLQSDEKAEQFTTLIDQPLPSPQVFDPAKSALHRPIENLDRTKKQHEWLTKKTRGKVYGGDYTQDSDQRELSASAMWREMGEVKHTMEDVAEGLSNENQTLSTDLTFVQANFKNLIRLYELAVLTYVPSDDPAKEQRAIETFNSLFAIYLSSPQDGFEKILTATAALN